VNGCARPCALPGHAVFCFFFFFFLAEDPVSVSLFLEVDALSAPGRDGRRNHGTEFPGPPGARVSERAWRRCEGPCISSSLLSSVMKGPLIPPPPPPPPPPPTPPTGWAPRTPEGPLRPTPPEAPGGGGVSNQPAVWGFGGERWRERRWPPAAGGVLVAWNKRRPWPGRRRSRGRPPARREAPRYRGGAHISSKQGRRRAKFCWARSRQVPGRPITGRWGQENRKTAIVSSTGG
jgi:hypothetical protein